MGQEYFNQIIPFDDTNPNSRKIILKEDTILIPIRNKVDGISASSLLLIDKYNFGSKIVHIPNYAFTRNSPFLVGQNLYAFSDNNLNNEMLSFLKIDARYNIANMVDYNTLSMNNGSTSSLFFQNHIYGASVDDFEGGDHREIAIKKIDTLGNQVWSKNFNKNIELSYAWEIDNTKDANILIAAGVHYYEKFGRFSQITKIDTSGEIIWTYEGDEPFENGAVPLWIAELSNDNIVMSYYISGNQSPDTRLLWIDKNGNYVKEQLIDVPIKDEMYYRQIEAGRGEYFFGYGIYRFNDDDTVHGIITKFDNDGNIIWEHLYQHESFAEANDKNSIKDIIELDNGDIVVLGDLSHLGEDTEIWLFKIDENGCFGTESCDEKLVLTNVDDTYFDPTLKIYPNPGTDIIHIVSEDRRMIDARFSIYNLSGQQIEKYTLSQMQNEINVSGLTSQIYIYQIEDKKGEVIGTGKFVKE